MAQRAANKGRQSTAIPSTATGNAPSLAWTVVLSLSIVVAIVFIYAPVAHYPFVGYDDPGYVTENPNIAGGLTWRAMGWGLTSGYFANWHPLTWWSHMLDIQLWGMNAGAHHVTNLVLHIANSLLLFFVLRRMTGATGRSACVAALFAVHPTHVESVAWIAERKDVLSTLFWILTMWAYVEYVRQPRRKSYVLVLVLYALGLMAKPMLVTLPFVLLLLDVWPLRRVRLSIDPAAVWWRLCYEKLPMLLLAGSSSVITFVVQQQSGAVEALDKLPLSVRVGHAIIAYSAYIAKMFWPVRLAVLYPYDKALAASTVAASATILLVISAAVMRWWRQRPYLAVGWLWYLGTLVPVIGLVQVGTQAMADRYTYIPFIGLFVIIVWGVQDLLARWPPARFILPITATGVAIAFALVARQQVGYWRSSLALWQHTVDVTAANEFAENNLAWDLANEGRYEDAISHYREALRLNPNFVRADINMAVALSEVGKLDEAVARYNEALRVTPTNVVVHAKLGVALARQGKLDEAIAHYSEALRLKPDYVEAHNSQGLALARQGKLDEAIRHYREAVQILPRFVEAHNNLGVALATKGQTAEAIEQFRLAVQYKPEYAEAHYNMAIVLASSGAIDEAAREFQAALAINPQYEAARRGLDNLARSKRAGSRGGA